MRKLDITIKTIIHKMMDQEFEVIEGKFVIEKMNSDIITPDEIENEIIMTYDISIDYAYLIVYEWMLINGLKNIKSNWFTTINHIQFDTLPNIIYPTINDNLTIEYYNQDNYTSLITPYLTVNTRWDTFNYNNSITYITSSEIPNKYTTIHKLNE